ncbi:MAG: OsmC family protein [Armatimonadetes bacterium]|nr:OsmC family protein [Armatimonadota bacterium]
MADIERTGEAVWRGDLKGGDGVVSTESGLIEEASYTFKTRFGGAEGTNPEELIAAAHAACYSMAFAHTLSEQGHKPERISTKATCSLVPTDGGFKIARMYLRVRGKVPGIDEPAFARIAEEADKGCPVSNLLRPGLEIQREVSLE